MGTDEKKPQPTLRDLSYPDIDDADANGMTLDDLDPEIARERRPTGEHRDHPAEGPDIG